MARKQILANKRRSQKRSNKKRARTIRSMRQVNGGMKKLFQRLSRHLGLGKSSNIPSEVNTPLLQDAAPVDELTYEQNFSLQPLMAPPVSPVSSDLKKKKVFSESKFDEDLRTLLQFHVEVAFPTEQNLEKINEFIFNPDNRDIVLSPLINHIKILLEENALFFQTLDDDLDHKKIVSIDTYLYNLMEYAKKIPAYELFKSIEYQLIQYVLEVEFLLSGFVDELEAAVNIGTLTFLNIFNDNIFNDSNVVPDTIQESEYLRDHVDRIVYTINEQIKLTAGGSKGKMRRPKSRTRKS